MASSLTMEALELRVRELERSQRKTRAAKLTVPRPCQVAVRRILGKLMESLENPLELTYLSKKDDKGAMETVIKETRRLYTDQGWSVGTCEEAFWRIWANKRDDQHRQITGKKEQHREGAKKNRRIRSKLQQRLKTLKSINWTEKRKEKVAAVLTRELTSPVVSDEEDCNLLRSVGFSWESDKLVHYKTLLDNERMASASSTAKSKMKTLRRHPTRVIESQPPKDLPSWSLRDEQDS